METNLSGRQSYRQSFTKARAVSNYDERVYRPGSSAEILWRAEAAIIRRLGEEILRARKNTSYLDFACGTGRVLALLEDLAESASGIDISAAMLDRARTKCRHASLMCKDITQPAAEIEGQYDLITSFRFLTNAEPDLRLAALRQLHRRLKDDGVLLINTHSNPYSYRLFFLPYHWLRDRFKGRELYGYLSNAGARRTLEAEGFRVERVIGMGFVPSKLLPVIPSGIAAAIESGLAGKSIVQRFGVNQLFVCVKK